MDESTGPYVLTVSRRSPESTCLVCGVCGLAGTPSKENPSENPYNRGVRDAGGSAGVSLRDGLRSPDRRTRSQSQHRLRYPVHVYKTLLHS